MENNQLVHVTSEGERWDSIAWKYYGSVNEAERIIRASPHMPITLPLPGGVRLFIPVVRPSDLESAASLPPWCGGFDPA